MGKVFSTSSDAENIFCITWTTASAWIGVMRNFHNFYRRLDVRLWKENDGEEEEKRENLYHETIWLTNDTEEVWQWNFV